MRRNLIIKTYFQKRPYDNIDKLDNAEQHICDGILTEHELAIALKEMKNQKKPWIRRTNDRVLQIILE